MSDARMCLHDATPFACFSLPISHHNLHMICISLTVDQLGLTAKLHIPSPGTLHLLFHYNLSGGRGWGNSQTKEVTFL